MRHVHRGDLHPTRFNAASGSLTGRDLVVRACPAVFAMRGFSHRKIFRYRERYHHKPIRYYAIARAKSQPNPDRHPCQA